MYIVVLVDADREDCLRLKAQLEGMAQRAGLVTLSHARALGQTRCHVINRVAVEELEAWFFGDIEAVRTAYPRVPDTLGRRAGYRNPDAISGGTEEALKRVLENAGHYSGIRHLPKIEVARRISEHMDPDRNTSASFRAFRDALRALCAAG